MFASLTQLLALALALQPALAGVYTTSPVGTTQATGGQVLTVAWADDGLTPSVASIGPCSVDLYTGGVDQQTLLQNLAASVDVSKASSVSATINPSVGQSGAYYFVRFTSLALKSAADPQYPYEAFSAKFAIAGMTGTWNATVLAQLASTGATTNASTSVAAAVSSASSAVPTAASVTTATQRVGASSASASAKPTSGAVARLAAPGILAGAMGIAAYLVM